jgi:hypothetical protein
MSHGMDAVTVDAASGTVKVQGGATIGKVDACLAPHNLILPMGRVGSTGCAGQMLTTGAHGYAERQYGLGIDYMTAATVVVGTGEIISCSATEHEDLFWAIRGGGSNFGVLIDMTFKPALLPNNGQFYGGRYVYLNTGMFGMPTHQKVMDQVVECMDSTRPHEYNLSSVFVGGGVNPAIVNHLWFGADTEQGKKYIAENCKKLGTAVDSNFGMHKYSDLQNWAKVSYLYTQRTVINLLVSEVVFRFNIFDCINYVMVVVAD